MGTFKHYTDSVGNTIELPDHEGFVESEVAEATYDDGTQSHWTSSSDSGRPTLTFRYRAACNCGWRADVVFDGNAPNQWRAEIVDRDPPGFLPHDCHQAVLQAWEAHADEIVAERTSLNPIAEADRAVRNALTRLRRTVRAARADGRSWSEIGAQLDISERVAWERFQDFDEGLPGD